MNTRVVVDPVTRIEGHLRIEAERSDDGQITGAWSSGTMVRGIELILQGRDPDTNELVLQIPRLPGLLRTCEAATRPGHTVVGRPQEGSRLGAMHERVLGRLRRS